MKKFILSLIIAINLVLSPVAVAAECPLCEAAKSGNLSEVKRLIENGANVNAVNQYGRTALIWAVVRDHSEIAKLLLDNGANVNVVNEQGDTALIEAVARGHSDVVRLLLDNGVNVNSTNQYGRTALIWAVLQGHAEISRVLLQCGANPDIRDYDRNSVWSLVQDKPLVYAILKKHLNDVVQGRQFPPCDKAAANKQNKNQPESGGGIETKKLPKESNIAEHVFENTWRSVVFINTDNAQGSGVIIQPNIVATNCHVVENENNIQVYKAEEKKTNREVSYSATILKRDEVNDFCLLSVDGLWGIPAIVRKYDTINIGEDVYGLGAPQGFDLSLSTGVVSQLRKEGDKRFIQTDTAISPGSSGGGLFDSEGNLIGILTLKFVSESVEGIGFAIPADLAL